MKRFVSFLPFIVGACGTSKPPEAPRADRPLTSYTDYQRQSDDYAGYIARVGRDIDCSVLEKGDSNLSSVEDTLKAYEREHPQDAERYQREGGVEKFTRAIKGYIERCTYPSTKPIASIEDYDRRDRARNAAYVAEVTSVRFPADCARHKEWEQKYWFTTEGQALRDYESEHHLSERPVTPEQERLKLAVGYAVNMCGLGTDLAQVLGKVAEVVRSNANDCAKLEQILASGDTPGWYGTVRLERDVQRARVAFGHGADATLDRDLQSFDAANAKCKLMNDVVRDDKDYTSRAEALASRVSSLVASNKGDCEQLRARFTLVVNGSELSDLDRYTNVDRLGARDDAAWANVAAVRDRLQTAVDRARAACP